VSAGEPLNEEVIYNWEEATGIVIKGQAQKIMTRESGTTLDKKKLHRTHTGRGSGGFCFQ
jgi:hypothetical protein